MLRCPCAYTLQRGVVDLAHDSRPVRPSMKHTEWRGSKRSFTANVYNSHRRISCYYAFLVKRDRHPRHAPLESRRLR